MAKVKCYVKECMEMEEGEVGLLLAFKNISSPGKVVETVNTLIDKIEGSVSFWQAIKVLITVWNG